VIIAHCVFILTDALSDEQFIQAQEIVHELKGYFKGQSVFNEPAIDGTWNGVAASLKEVVPGSSYNRPFGEDGRRASVLTTIDLREWMDGSLLWRLSG